MKIAFDTETTGTNPKKDELLQITIVDENCNILLETYLKPPTRTSWFHAEKVNHISYDMVKDAPEYDDVRDQIKEIFDNATEIIGYNIAFDIGIVESNLKFNIDRTKTRDLLKEFRAEANKKNVFLPHYRLGDAVDFYCPQYKTEYLENAHDASCDTIATMRVCNALDADIPRFVPEIKNTKILDEFLSQKKYKKYKEVEIQTQLLNDDLSLD